MDNLLTYIGIILQKNTPGYRCLFDTLKEATATPYNSISKIALTGLDPDRPFHEWKLLLLFMEGSKIQQRLHGRDRGALPPYTMFNAAL